MNARRLWLMAAPLALGVLLPACLALYYVHRFAVNVPIYDEWNFMPIVAEFYADGDWWPMVVEHYGEHRIILPKLIILLLSKVTALDVRVESFLSALLMVGSAFIAWLLIRRTEGCPRWAIIPVGWLLLSTAQFENLLVGWQFQIPLMNLAAIGAVWLLVRDRPALASASAAVATFSFANGMMIWPAALPLVWRLPRRRRALVIWIGAAVLAAVAYRWGYEGFERPPDNYLSAVLRHPTDAARMFLALYGNNFGGGLLSGNIAAGACLLALTGLTLWLVHRAAGWRSTDVPWLTLFLFSLLSVGAVVLGRSFVWKHMATPSRFLTVAIFIPVALTVMMFRVAAALRQRGPRLRLAAGLAAAALLAAGSYQQWRTARVGWGIGGAQRAYKLSTVPCLLDYRSAPVDCLRKLYVADGEFVRRNAAVLERYGLGPFEGRAPSSAPPLAVEFEGTLDFAGKPRQGSVPAGHAQAQGWALTADLESPAAVLLTVDGRWVAATAEFQPRRDVEKHFGRRLPPCGWTLSFSLAGLAPGEHEVRALALAPGQAAPLPVPGSKTIVVTGDSEPAVQGAEPVSK